MAERKLHAGRTPGTIVADSSGAARKFGFHTSHGTPISAAPKLSDMWYAEFKGVHGAIMDDVSGLCKAVSPISVQTTTQQVDQYGKRVYIPTRVDFPEVTFTMHDTIDGNTMMLAEGMYRRFFKNGDMKIDNGAMQSSIEENDSFGRKLAFGNDTFKNFERITLFHWFGDLETTGSMQRIVLVNPVVTNITFSNSDYSSSELRTIDFTVQPESIVFGTPYDVEPAIPEWMGLGLEYILQSATLDMTNYVSSRLRANLIGKKQLAAFGELGVDTREFISEEQAPGHAQLGKFAEPLTDAQVTAREANASAQKMSELSSLYAELKAAEESQDADAKKDVLERLVNARNETGYIEARYANRTNTSGSDFAAETLIPNLGNLNTTGGRPVGTEQFNSSAMSNIFAQELTSSFFNGRSFDLGNVTNGISQGILGNSGIGTLQNLGRTSTSRFGPAGDIVRDSIINNSRNSRRRSTSSGSNTSSGGSSVKSIAQRGIGALRNLTKGLRF